MGLFKNRPQADEWAKALGRSTAIIEATIVATEMSGASNIQEEMDKADALSKLREQFEANKALLATSPYPYSNLRDRTGASDILTAIEQRDKKRQALTDRTLSDEERDRLLDEIYRAGRRGPRTRYDA